jgi:hypothetical protein
MEFKSLFLDYCGKIGRFEFSVRDDLTPIQIVYLVLRTKAMSTGNNFLGYLYHREIAISGVKTPPTNKFSQKSLRFLCRYTDTVTRKKYEFSIPCAKADFCVGNTDMVDLSTGAGLDLKTSFEECALSELGNPVVLDSVELIGRNSH